MTTELKETETESKALSTIAEFNEFETKLTEFKEKYAGVVYDLSDKKQRKQAGADRLAIGKVVVKLDKAHKDIKAPLLAKTKLLDGERKRIKDDLQSVQNEIGSQIKKHDDAIREHDELLQQRVANIVNTGTWDAELILNSQQLGERLAYLKAIVIDDSFEAQKGNAAIAKDETIQKIEGFIAVAKVKEIELEKAEVERQAKATEDRRLEAENIRNEAKKKATADAQKLIDDAEAATKAAEKRTKDAEAKVLLDASEKERLALEETERLKLEAQQAEAKAKRDAKQAKLDQEWAVKAEADRIEVIRVENDRVEVAAKAAREADTDHRREVDNNAIDDIEALGISRIAAKSFVQAVAKELIRGISISY